MKKDFSVVQIGGRQLKTMEDRYGGFWRRTMAFLTDTVIIMFILLIILFVGMLALWSGSSSPYGELVSEELLDTLIGFMISYSFVAVLIHMLYFTYFHGTCGQTPGKMIFGLQVVQTTGEEMTLGLAFLRWIGYIISKIFLYLGFIWVAFDLRKQGWHDKIAGTVVIHMAKD
jgi:uncharacterized RDD family membrane protein YckC